MATEKIPEEVLDTFAEIRARLVELGEQVVEIDQLVVDAMTKLLRPELFEAVAPRFPVSDGSVGLVAALDRIKGKEARQQYYAGFSMTEAQ